MATHMKIGKPFIVSYKFRSHRFFANGVISARLDAEHKIVAYWCIAVQSVQKPVTQSYCASMMYKVKYRRRIRKSIFMEWYTTLQSMMNPTPSQ